MNVTRNDTPETAAVKLAERLVKGREKRAFGLSDVTGWLNNGAGGAPNPAHWLAAGAGVGGLAGLASSYNREPDDRRPFSSALTGAIAGGAALGGGALAAPAIKGMFDNVRGAMSPNSTAGGGGGVDIKALRDRFSQLPNDAAGQSQAQQMLQGMGDAEREALSAHPNFWDQNGEEITGVGERFAGGYAAGALGDSAVRTMVNPLGRGAATLGKDFSKDLSKQMANVDNPTQLSALWNAMKGNGRSTLSQAAEGAEAAVPGLTNAGVRNIWRAGMRSPLKAMASVPGLMMGAGAAAAPYMMPGPSPVSAQELAQ